LEHRRFTEFCVRPSTRRAQSKSRSTISFPICPVTGNLTDDPELRYNPSGKPVVSASIANNEHYTDAQGEEQKVTTFVNLQIWGKPAENFGNLVKKGQELFVDGKLRVDEWTDKQTKHSPHSSLSAGRKLAIHPVQTQGGGTPEAPTPAPAPYPVAADTKKAKKGTK
jgi:single-strand DNA-binding protein